MVARGGVRGEQISFYMPSGPRRRGKGLMKWRPGLGEQPWSRTTEQQRDTRPGSMLGLTLAPDRPPAHRRRKQVHSPLRERWL